MTADVTKGSDKLVQAIGDDSEAVICATGFRPGWNLFAPWKVISRFEIFNYSVLALIKKHVKS